MGIIHWIATVCVAGGTMDSPVFYAIYAFVSTLCLWSMTYVAQELEQPYGDDPNDLPLYAMQTSLNDSLVTLLHHEVQQPPGLTFDPDKPSLECKLWNTAHDPNARLKGKAGKAKVKQYSVPSMGS